jgi:hypothetical protein
MSGAVEPEPAWSTRTTAVSRSCFACHSWRARGTPGQWPLSDRIVDLAAVIAGVAALLAGIGAMLGGAAAWRTYRTVHGGATTIRHRRLTLAVCSAGFVLVATLLAALAVARRNDGDKRPSATQVGGANSSLLGGRRICGETAFDDNLRTTQPLFQRPDGYLSGWISSDPSTVTLPDGTRRVFSTQVVLVVIDVTPIKVSGVETSAGRANTWGCWYAPNESQFVEQDAAQDLCKKKAGELRGILRDKKIRFQEAGHDRNSVVPVVVLIRGPERRIPLPTYSRSQPCLLPTGSKVRTRATVQHGSAAPDIIRSAAYTSRKGIPLRHRRPSRQSFPTSGGDRVESGSGNGRIA